MAKFAANLPFFRYLPESNRFSWQNLISPEKKLFSRELFCFGFNFYRFLASKN